MQIWESTEANQIFPYSFYKASSLQNAITNQCPCSRLNLCHPGTLQRFAFSTNWSLERKSSSRDTLMYLSFTGTSGGSIFTIHVREGLLICSAVGEGMHFEKMLSFEMQGRSSGGERCVSQWGRSNGTNKVVWLFRISASSVHENTQLCVQSL